MPLTILVASRAAQRRFVDTPSRALAWQLLHREADRMYPQLRTLWDVILRDFQDSIDPHTLRGALQSGNVFQIERSLNGAWQQLSSAVRAPLQLLLSEAAQRSAEALLPQAQEALGAEIAVQFGVVVPQVVSAVETYAGTQIQAIGDTTLQNVRTVIRSGVADGRSLTQMMRDLESFVGLTPRQTEALEALRQRLRASGQTRAQVQQQVDRAARRALQRRLENIARTESIAAASLGQQGLWEEAQRQGTLDPARFLRTWLVTPDDRLCQRICAPIPGMNPNGVRLDEPFQTPVGPVMFPPAHPQCRCAVNGRVL